MIRVSIFYPTGPQITFDYDYHINHHVPFVHELLAPLGLRSYEIDRGISAPNPKDPPGFLVMEHLVFNNVDTVHKAFIQTAKPILDDVKNFTNCKPSIQISETLTLK